MPILDAVRKACPSGLWSQGVKLAREGAVSVDQRGPTEVTLRVRAPRVAVPPTVTLYLQDEEWSCDCMGKLDPCEHVAAAVIVFSQSAAPGARDEPTASIDAPAPRDAPKAHVGYRLRRQDRSLYLSRAIVPDGGAEQPLRGSLASLVAKATARDGASAAGALLPTHEDLALDKLVGPQPEAFLPVVRMHDLLALLASASDVTLDGRPVRCAGDPVAPRAFVRDTDTGIVVKLERHPDVQEVVARGVVRAGDALRPMAAREMTGELLEHLPRARRIPPEGFPEFVTRELPALEAQLEVRVESRRLPRRARAIPPRVLLELSQPLRAQDAALSVVPLLVYGDPPQARIDDGRLVHLGGEIPVRDEGAERRILSRLREDLELVPGRRVEFYGRDAARFAARLKAWAVHDPEQTVLASTLLTPTIAEGDGFSVTFATSDGARHATADAVVRAWEEGLDIVPLTGGGWAPLPADWLNKHGRRLSDLLAARDDRGEVPRSAATLVARLCEALERPPPPAFAGLAAALADFSRIPRATLPPLYADLRAYQQAGVDWLCFLRDAGLGAVLADDMGLGKTLQTIAALRGRALVVAPRSVIHNWAAELAKFRPSLRVSLYHGPRRALDRGADVTLTTYAVMRLDLERLRGETWDTLVLDEAQAIKNPDSQVARAAFELDARFRVALSGTPVENRLDELWSIFHFANRGLLGGRSDFQERFAAPIAAGEAGVSARLRERVRPFLLRRLKREVAPELPPRTDIVLHVELEDSERAVYDAVRAAAKRDVLAKLAERNDVLAALEALLRLRQAACHPGLVPGQRADTSSKVDALVEALADAASEGHKALVFSQWTAMLDLIEPHLADIPFVRLDGGTRDRAGVVARFQADDGPPVMLVSLKAGGTGLNLTAADHVFLVDPWWNPAVEDQAADRAHRIGQDKPVFVHRLVAKDTVEEGIVALQAKKRALADAALAAGDHAGGITRDELLALLA